MGNHIGGTQYRDSRDITGTIPEMYEDAMRWLKSCLSRPQNGQSFNSEGDLEISEVVLQELVQNALVHLDLLKPAAIRLLVFDNRVEIVNPGCLPDGQTIDEILLGNSDPRNPQLAQFGSKTMPYRDLIMKALEQHERMSRPEINALLMNKLPEALTEKQKLSKIGHLLTYLRQSGKIEIGDKKQWQLKEFSQK